MSISSIFLWHGLEQHFAVIETICSISTLPSYWTITAVCTYCENDVSLHFFCHSKWHRSSLGHLICQHLHLVGVSSKLSHQLLSIKQGQSQITRTFGKQWCFLKTIRNKSTLNSSFHWNVGCDPITETGLREQKTLAVEGTRAGLPQSLKSSVRRDPQMLASVITSIWIVVFFSEVTFSNIWLIYSLSFPIFLLFLCRAMTATKAVWIVRCDSSKTNCGPLNTSCWPQDGKKKDLKPANCCSGLPS